LHIPPCRSDTSVKDKAKYYKLTEPVYMQGPTPTKPALMSTDPWMLYLYAVRSPATSERYVMRLMRYH
jgi:hypothetical protein